MFYRFISRNVEQSVKLLAAVHVYYQLRNTNNNLNNVRFWHQLLCWWRHFLIFLITVALSAYLVLRL